MADNASDTATGQNDDKAGTPTSDDTETAVQVPTDSQHVRTDTPQIQSDSQQVQTDAPVVQPGSPQGQADSEHVKVDSGQVQTKTRGSGRVSSGMRDMVLSMVVLAAGVLILAAITRSCSFSPGGPSTNSSSLPTVDVSAELRAAAGQIKFPLRQPQLPDGWRANSDSVDQLGPNGADQAVRIGWIAPDGRYLQGSQSDAGALDLVRSAAALGDEASISPTGTETVNGTKWTVYPGVRDELSWVTDLGTERLFITGNGTTADFRTLATATMTGRKVTAVGF